MQLLPLGVHLSDMLLENPPVQAELVVDAVLLQLFHLQHPLLKPLMRAPIHQLKPAHISLELQDVIPGLCQRALLRFLLVAREKPLAAGLGDGLQLAHQGVLKYREAALQHMHITFDAHGAAASAAHRRASTAQHRQVRVRLAQERLDGVGPDLVVAREPGVVRVSDTRRRGGGELPLTA
eukprot:CAMPEP_0195130804 /NCGR_PEP_ID=MMETSP0448-20130528/143895_1 /TAXON_ID=66468 /ORGANISM="Heterocapsa triquestra, Strain CCMP 448" /LENGTH=179 /DNA_ID=CAMNT_0040168729 /DNA_START=77 /DNA_END=613 /DNA_ORIENTATION=-